MSERQHISLLKLQSIIKERLEDVMPLPCWVTAEISEIKVNYSGHCYLELIEKGADDTIPVARASAIIWRSTFGAVSSYFRSATGGDLAEGMNILMKVSVQYHEVYGLSLIVSDIDPLYTMGDMERQRQLTIERLQQDGVYEMNRQLELPAVVQRLAVVSSRNAAGYQDFMNELAASGYRFDVTLFDAFMQGRATEDSVISALERIVENTGDYDVVVIIRGGGSQSDLGAFDSYRLCCHIAQFPLPVITGIGHDKDESVADMVAAVPLKTPTAVGAWLVGNLAEFEGWLDNTRDAIARQAATMLDVEEQRLMQAAHSLSRTTSDLTRSLELRLEQLRGELLRHLEMVVFSRGNRLESLSSSLRDRASRLIAVENGRLEAMSQMARSRTPERILSLGFAIVRHEGKALMDSSHVRAGDALEITLAKGTLDADVK